jgi:hypothetical protein
MEDSSELIDRLRLGIEERLEQMLAEAQRLRRALAALDTDQRADADRQATCDIGGRFVIERHASRAYGDPRDSAAPGATNNAVLGALAAGDPVTAWRVAAATGQAARRSARGSPGSRRAMP